VPAERPLARALVQGALLGGLVLLAAVPVYVYVEPSWRPLVARSAAAFVLGVTLLQLRRVLAQHLDAQQASGLDAARRLPASPPEVPAHFLGLTSDVRAALRSRRYFEHVMWPRLTALAAGPLKLPQLRPGRGPGAAALGRVLDDVEASR
jgi:hypothetical protein